MKTKTIASLTMPLLMTTSGVFAANFGDDLKFLRQHTGVVLVQDKAGGAQVAGRARVAGMRDDEHRTRRYGASFGWVNRDRIASGKLQPHINVFGREDRFWLGPEVGQFSIFFAKGTAFGLQHWFTPASLDTEPFTVVKEGVMFFRADAQFRSKIGLSPRRSKELMGSYDAANRTLTLVKFTLPKGATDYVNSMWKLQDDPFNGDAVHSYNDDGKLGKFYKLESSSPALALAPGASAVHRHQTIHLQGGEKELEAIAQATLGVGLEAIRT